VVRALVAASIGFGSGVASGAFGIGGALLSTPGIRVLLNTPAIVAVGTTLPVIIPTAVTGLRTYVRNGFVDTRLAAWAATGGLVCSVGGALLTGIIPGEILLVATAVVIFYLAVRMLPTAAPATAPHPHPGVPAALAVGGLSGFASGLLGVGGGFVLVPLFTVTFGLPLKTALGTSLAVVAVQAVPGSIVHAALGHVDWTIVAGMAVGVVPGAWLGSRLAVAARDKTLRTVVAVALMVLAAAFAAGEIRALLR
jgi:uncharacterized membrane protein YfcA